MVDYFRKVYSRFDRICAENEREARKLKPPIHQSPIIDLERLNFYDLPTSERLERYDSQRSIEASRKVEKWMAEWNAKSDEQKDREIEELLKKGMKG